MVSANGTVARILYKEIVDGDLRKIRAESNDSDSGGGARDFRFGSYARLRDTVEKLFPEHEPVQRRRGRQATTIHRLKGTFYWNDATGARRQQTAYFEPPTDARPDEGRITRVHEYPCFETQLKPCQGNRLLLLFIQIADGTVWPHYAEERSLRTPNAWDAKVATELITCLDAKRPAGRVVIGVCDFEVNKRYCNGA